MEIKLDPDIGCQRQLCWMQSNVVNIVITYALIHGNVFRLNKTR